MIPMPVDRPHRLRQGGNRPGAGNASARLATLALIAALLVPLSAGLSGCSGEQSPRGNEEQQRLRLSEFYLEQGEIRASIIEARNALQQNPNSAAAQVLLARIYLEIEDGKSAEAAVGEAARMGSDDPELVAYEVRALLMQRKFDQALSLVPDAGAAGTDGARWATFRGEALLGLGEIDAAAAEYRRALGEVPDYGPALLGLAKISLASGDEAGVDEMLDRAIEADESLVDAWVWRARLALLRENLPEAERAYYKVRELESNDVLTRRKIESLHGVMKAKIGQNRLDEAFKYYEDFLAFYPNSLLAEYERGLGLFREGNLASAEEVFETIVDRSPGHDQSVLLLGLINYSRGNDRRVAELLEEKAGSDDADALTRRLYAMARLRSNQPAEALAVLEQEANRENPDPETLSLYGVALLTTGDKTAAEEVLTRAHALAPDSVPIRLNLARFYISSGKPDQATGILGDSAAAGIQSAQAEFLRIAARLQRGEQGAAEERATALVRRQSGSDESLAGALAGISAAALGAGQGAWARAFLQTLPQDLRAGGLSDQVLARVCMELRDAACAADAARRAVDARPGEAGAYQVLGRAELAAGRAAEAAEAFEKLAELRPEDANAHARAGTARLRAGDAGRAREHIEAALALDQDNADALQLAATMALRSGEMALATQRVDELRATGDRSLATRELEADLLFAEQRFAEAAKAYDDLQAGQPATGFVIKRFGATVRAGDKQRAFADLESWISAQPSDRLAVATAANAYLADGQHAKAIGHYETLLESVPGDPSLLNNLAWLYQQTGDSRALDYAERAYSSQPDSAAILDTLGWILVERGEYERGIDLLERAVEIDPDMSDARQHLEAARQRAGG